MPQGYIWPDPGQKSHQEQNSHVGVNLSSVFEQGTCWGSGQPGHLTDTVGEMFFPGWENVTRLVPFSGSWGCPGGKTGAETSSGLLRGGKPAGAARAELKALAQLSCGLCLPHQDTAKCAKLSLGHKCSHTACLQNGQKYQYCIYLGAQMLVGRGGRGGEQSRLAQI